MIQPLLHHAGQCRPFHTSGIALCEIVMAEANGKFKC
jgi:hypothetical protein